MLLGKFGNMYRLKQKEGYTLIEVVLVIIIIGIITSIAIKSLRKSTEIARTEETKKEMQELADAITGRRELCALPTNLDNLVTRPPGYSSWNGPYIFDDFSKDGSSTEFKKDAWGKNYIYSGSITISSNGDGSTITRNIANSIDDLLYNRVVCVVTDLNNTPPGTVFRDSIIISLRYPNGSGSYTTRSQNPDINGLSDFDSIPVGLHELSVIYSPLNDTLRRIANVDLGTDYYSEISLSEDIW